MNIINNNGIPDPIFRAIKKGWYSGAGAKHYCSVTELLKPEKMFALERRYRNTINQEASELIWSLMGSAMHRVLEASETKNTLNEERLFATVNGKIISGGIDLYENRIISDFKFTSVWSYIYTSRKREWEQQLNLYSYLYQSAGFEVDRLQIIAIFRDWSAAKARYEKSYPRQIEVIPIEKWDRSWCRHFIAQKLDKSERALSLPDDAISVCSPQERWQDPVKYAVMKKGNKRALKLFDSKESATRFISSHKDKKRLFIDIRESIPRRCESYCVVNRFCNFYQSYKNMKYNLKTA